MAVNKGIGTGHLLLRLLGLTGAFVAVAAAVVWKIFPDGDVKEQSLYAVYGGLGALAIGLLAELPGIFGMVTSRRGALGTTVFVQVALAIALVVGVNAFSFDHFRRFDLTWDQAFTLNKDLRDQLAELRDPTDIVVVQRNLSSGLTPDEKPDIYDIAAPKQIIDKVRDLAEQFGDLGARFRVKVLDIQDPDFEDKVKALRESEKKEPGEASPLADAIDAATENSIFFKSKGKVQRLAFHDVYLVDKQKSKDANHKKGNLVLHFQGVEPFARKILDIEAQTPTVAFAVVHPALSSKSIDVSRLSMSGARKSLESHGFNVRDILLRKRSPRGGLSPDASAESFDENRLEIIEDNLPRLDERIKVINEALAETAKNLAEWRDKSLKELQVDWIYIKLKDGREGVQPRKVFEKIPPKFLAGTLEVDAEDKALRVARYTDDEIVLKDTLERDKKRRDEMVAESAKLNIEGISERRRTTDAETRLNKMLQGVDLLVIPRLTAQNFAVEPEGGSENIPHWVHRLDEGQLKAIKSFLMRGKAVLFLLGSTNEHPASDPPPPEFGGPGGDGLEALLKELKIELPNQTILYNVEVDEFTDRRVGFGEREREIKLPPITFHWKPGAGQVKTKADEEFAGGIHPIRASMDAVAKAVGERLVDELQIRHPRPVYVVADATSPGRFDEAAVFLMTDPATWNEKSPFVGEKKDPPGYNRPKDDDPTRGTLEEERHGPFPIAVAVDRTLPRDWFKGAEPTKARVGVVGNGAVFIGNSLSPIKEKLLLDTCNWLVGRDDLLTRQSSEFSFPRVPLTPAERNLWHWGTFLGLPLTFLYLGLFVWLVRRFR